MPTNAELALRATLVLNERCKLIANSLYRAATVCVTVGVATPAASLVYGQSSVDGGIRLLAAAAVFFFVAANLHLAAQTVLERLR